MQVDQLQSSLAAMFLGWHHSLAICFNRRNLSNEKQELEAKSHELHYDGGCHF